MIIFHSCAIQGTQPHQKVSFARNVDKNFFDVQFNHITCLVPNCLGAKLSAFIILVPNCPLYYLGAKLSGAKLSGAKLSGAKLSYNPPEQAKNKMMNEYNII